MKAQDVGVGKTYLIRFHDGVLTPVTVLRETERRHYVSHYSEHAGGSHTGYICRNERTGREITIKSAAKFRQELERNPVSGKWRVKVGQPEVMENVG